MDIRATDCSSLERHVAAHPPLTADELLEPLRTGPGPAALCDGSTVLVPAASPNGSSVLVAVDGSTGAKLWEGERLDHPVAADGYAVGYVQPGTGHDSQVVVDATTGEQLWRKPGRESYGDLWAIGDGAVYVTVMGDQRPEVVAYELESGDERWRRPTGMSLPSEQVADDTVVLLWDDLAVLSTDDGTTRWTVPAVSPETPMSSVGHNAVSILVSFNSRPWGD